MTCNKKNATKDGKQDGASNDSITDLQAAQVSAVKDKLKSVEQYVDERRQNIRKGARRAPKKFRL